MRQSVDELISLSSMETIQADSFVKFAIDRGLMNDFQKLFFSRNSIPAEAEV